MRISFKTPHIFLILLCLGACIKSDPFPRKITFYEIYKGDMYGANRQSLQHQNFEIRDSNTWNALLFRLDSAYNVSNQFNETAIDFSQFDVLAVFDSARSSLGYNIHIEEIIELEDRVQVTIQKHGGGGALMVGQPFHIVKIHKTPKRFVFVEH